MATKPEKTYKHLSPEWRVERAQKGALARWGSPSHRAVKKFLQTLAGSYCDQFSSAPELIDKLVTPLTQWSDSLEEKPVPEVETRILSEEGNA